MLSSLDTTTEPAAALVHEGHAVVHDKPKRTAFRVRAEGTVAMEERAVGVCVPHAATTPFLEEVRLAENDGTKQPPFHARTTAGTARMPVVSCIDTRPWAGVVNAVFSSQYQVGADVPGTSTKVEDHGSSSGI